MVRLKARKAAGRSSQRRTPTPNAAQIDTDGALTIMKMKATRATLAAR